MYLLVFTQPLNVYFFRFITEKEFEYKSWFLYYPEEGNKRGSPLTLFR